MDKTLISNRFKEVLRDLKMKKRLPGYEYLASNYNPKAPKAKQFISEMTNGRVLPNEEVVKFLSEKYGVSRDYIYEGRGNMYIESTNKEQQNTTDMDPLTERLLQSYEERIKEHKEFTATLKEINDKLISNIDFNLGRILRTQKNHEAAMEARQDMVLRLLATHDNPYEAILDNVYNSEGRLIAESNEMDIFLETGTRGKK